MVVFFRSSLWPKLGLLSICLISIACSLSNCKKDREDYVLNPEKGEYVPMELVVLTTNGNERLGEGQYDAVSKRGEIIPIVFEDSIAYTFATESLVGESTKFDVEDVDGREFTFELSVVAGPSIDNPEEIISDFENTYLPEVSTFKESLLGESFDLDNMDAQDLQQIELTVKDFRDALSSASSEEKKTLARFIEANKEVFMEPISLGAYVDSLNSNKKESTPFYEEALESGAGELAKSSIKLKILVAATATICVVEQTKLGCLAAGAVLVYATKGHIRLIQVLMNKVFAPHNTALEELKSSKRTITLSNNIEYKLFANLELRTLNKDDLNSSNPNVQQVISNLDLFGALYLKMKSYLSYFLKSPAPHIKDKTDFRSKDFNTIAELVSIEEISNSKVKVETKVEGNEFYAIFTTDVSEPQNFRFKMKYDDGHSVLYDEAEAILEKGSYHIADVSAGSNGFGYWMLGNLIGEKLSPLGFKVVDDGNQPVNGAEITWKVFVGGGTLDYAKTTTADSGYTENYWTLGDYEEIQEVEVVVRVNGAVIEDGRFKFLSQACGHNLIKIQTPKIVCKDFTDFKIELPFEEDDGSGAWHSLVYDDRVMIEFKNDQGEWNHATNGYSYNLIEGDVRNGTYECRISFSGSSFRCQPSGEYTKRNTYFNGWRVFMVDACGLTSNVEYFELEYYTKQ